MPMVRSMTMATLCLAAVMPWAGSAVVESGPSLQRAAVSGAGAPGALVGIIDPSWSGGSTGLDSLNQAVVVAYTYLGLDTLVQVQSSRGPGWSDISGSGSTLSNLSTYLNQFSQIAEIKWVGVGRIGRRQSHLYQYNYRQLSGYAQDKTYTFDPLGELLTATEGETETTYTYDSFGNASSANEANELSSQGYNSGGETTENRSGNVLIYDAWGRLVKIEVSSEDSAVIANYTYNGLNEMVTETVPSGGGTQTTRFIYTSQMQILEERIGGTVQSQYLWGADYVNDLILIKTAPSGGQTLWVQHDANYDVISVALQNDESIGESTVENRYDYSAFGQVTLENASFEAVDSTSYYVDMLFQGMRFDSATGLYNTNERWYNPALGVFITRDPLGLGGDAVDEYRFVGNNPTSGYDPIGCSGGEIPTGWMRFAPTMLNDFSFPSTTLCSDKISDPALPAGDVLTPEQWNNYKPSESGKIADVSELPPLPDPVPTEIATEAPLTILGSPEPDYTDSSFNDMMNQKSLGPTEGSSSPGADYPNLNLDSPGNNDLTVLGIDLSFLGRMYIPIESLDGTWFSRITRNRSYWIPNGIDLSVLGPPLPPFVPSFEPERNAGGIVPAPPVPRFGGFGSFGFPYNPGTGIPGDPFTDPNTFPQNFSSLWTRGRSGIWTPLWGCFARSIGAYRITWVESII